MLMLKSTMDFIAEKDERIDELRDEIANMRVELKYAHSRAEKAEEKASWEVEKIKHEVKVEMQKTLIRSDLEKTEAVAKLNTYIDMDTKDERKHIQTMLEKAIESLGQQKVTVNTK